MGDEAKYHSDRAMAEIDLASRAPSLEAARSHLSVSAVHLERLRGLAQSGQGCSTLFRSR